MDTQQIFDDLREPLGDTAARVLARTFNSVFTEMRESVTREDFRHLQESIHADVSRLDRSLTKLSEAQSRTEARVEELAVAQSRTEARVEELAVAQSRTEARVEELAVAQSRTEARVEELAVAQSRTEARVEELAQAQNRTEARVEELAEAQSRTEQSVARLIDSQSEMQKTMQRLTIRTDDLSGWAFESRFRDRIASYLGRFVRRCRLADTGDLIDQLRSLVTDDELDDVLRADAVASGLLDDQRVYVIAEVSVTADADDIDRARRRGELLRKTGVNVIPMVACQTISPGYRSRAAEAGVQVWVDGGLIGPPFAA